MTKWVTKKLGEIGDIVTGSTPQTNKDIYWNGEYNFYSPADFTEDIYCKNTERTVTELGLNTGRIIPENSIMVACIASIGKLAINKNKGITNQQINTIIPYLDNDYKFIYYLLLHNVNSIKSKAAQTTIPIINKEDFSSLEFLVPESLAEQRRIAGILSSADGAIAASEALIEKYRNIKRGLLTTLLQPKEGWKKVKLGECLTIGNGQDYKHLHKGDIPVYGTGGVMTYVDDYLYEGETVCIGRKGTINKPIFHCGKIWTVDTLFYTHSYVNVLPLFMYYAFCCIDWLRYNEATGVPSLSKETIYKIEINIPEDLAEQRRIAEILSSVDAKIAAEEKVVEKYKGVKKGLMEEMMNGE